LSIQIDLKHQAHFDPSVPNTILQNLYTDDCLKSWPTEAEALPLAHNLIACAKGAFQLSKWFRNSRVVMSSIPEGQRSKAIKELDLDQVKSSNDLPMERVLGLHWCTEKDKFAYP